MRFLCAMVLLLGSVFFIGGGTAMAQREVSRERNVMSISCDLVEGVQRDALCKLLYHQVRQTIPGYIYRQLPTLLDAPTRPKDMRVRLIIEPNSVGVRLQLEWYLGAEDQPERGKVVEIGDITRATSQDLTVAIADLLEDKSFPKRRKRL